MIIKQKYLVGCGSDSHRIIKSVDDNRPIILAGTVVSKEYNPVSHSDGDVVYHAISNALFLAIGERDIGYHFPDTDPKYKGITGDKLLEYTFNLVKNFGYMINNLTIMITAGEPKISKYVESMKENISKSLEMDIGCIGIGATTGEKLSDIGRGKGIEVIAMVYLKRVSKYR